MHLADGVLPLGWAACFAALAAPFVAVALALLRRRGEVDFRLKPLLAMVAAAVFLLSAMPIPVPFVGTCSHPCGTGLAAILVGPWMTVIVALVALLLQALFLAHGGFTTLGADLLSMGIAGGFAGWLAFWLLRRGGASLSVAAFAGGLLSDWCTYAVTAGELALAVHGARPISQVFGAVALAFVPVQLPLGLLEAALTAGAVSFVARRRPDLLLRLGVAGSAS
ncbi:MAG TPA: energy-coupling factor ABC transporter permease [Anaeromyxobacteraceae bacterium]|nr:energy-coupling factor ABC transporter permease [Anaeromyxobacteraceae bacterium]